MSAEDDLVRLDLVEVLERLGHTPGDGGFIGIGIRPGGCPFQTMVVAAERADSHVTGFLTHSDHPRSDMYFSVNSVRARLTTGRGGKSDVTRWCALFCDFDVKPGAFTNINDALVCVAAVSAMLGTRPSVLIFSGHGVQPLWPIEDGMLDTEAKWQRATRLSRRFGRLVAEVAWRNHQAGVDFVFDLSRLLRVPNTFNHKDPRHLALAYAVADTGAPLTVDQIEEILDAWGVDLDVPARPSDSAVRGEVISDPEDWGFARSDCNYATAMVSRWGTDSDRPKAGRHQWAMDRATRLACAQRLGCLTEDGLDSALEHLESSLAHWCQLVGVPRPLHRNEIRGDTSSAWSWGQDKASKLTDEQTRAELGGHIHDSKNPFGIRFRRVPVRVPGRRQQSGGWPR